MAWATIICYEHSRQIGPVALNFPTARKQLSLVVARLQA
jgi:hypothetical protein